VQTAGQALAQAIGAESYMECSARTLVNVKEVIEECLRVVLNGPKRLSRRHRPGGCVLQ